MAVAAQALSLGEYYLQSNDPIIKEVSYSMIKAGSIFTDIPLVTKKTMKMSGLRIIDNLPVPDYVPINTTPTVVKGKATAYEEEIWILRNAIDIDDMIYQDENAVGDPFDIQIEMYLRGLAYDLNDKVINNYHTNGPNTADSDPDCFVGIRARLDNPAVYGNNAACKIDAGGVDLSDTGLATAANGNKFIRIMQQMLDEIGSPDGSDVAIYMNDDLLRRIEQGVRTLGAGGGFDMTTDAYDRRIMTYKNAKICNIGRKAPIPGGTQSTYIISSTETAAGLDGASTFTSMYAIRYGVNDFCGWQFGPLKPTEPYKLNDGVIWQSVINWGVGIWQPNTRSVARVFDIKVA